MTQDEFNNYTNDIRKAESNLRVTKGAEYAPDHDDVLSNFKVIAGYLPKTVRSIDVCSVYFMKHILSILDYLHTGNSRSTESIQSRIQDARNYLLLLGALIHEQKIGESGAPETSNASEDTGVVDKKDTRGEVSERLAGFIMPTLYARDNMD